MNKSNISLSNKTIVVTGGAGFLGTHIVSEISKLNPARIVVPRSKEYNLVERENIVRLLSNCRPHYIIHTAGIVGGIGANRANPGRFLYENLMMGTQLLECARLHGVEKLVLIGTICSYPKFAPIPFREENLWDGYPEETNAPYGLAKKMLLVQSLAYRQQYGFNSLCLLPVNLYGPGDNFDPDTSHVIPAIIRKCTEAMQRGDDTIVCWGDGSPTREFLYVEDAAQGIVSALLRYNSSEPVNLGTGKEISIRNLVTTIAKQIGFQGKIVWDGSKPNGQPRRCLDTSKAEKLFGFKSSTSLELGLQKTIDWYLRKMNAKKSDPVVFP